MFRVRTPRRLWLNKVHISHCHNTLAGHRLSKDNSYSNAFTCNTLDDFCTRLEGVIDTSKDSSTIYLVCRLSLVCSTSPALKGAVSAMYPLYRNVAGYMCIALQQVLDHAERLHHTPEFSSYLKLRELVCMAL